MGKDLIPPHIVGPGRESFVTVSRAAPHVQMLYYLCKLQAACCMLLSVGNSNPHKVFRCQHMPIVIISGVSKG